MTRGLDMERIVWAVVQEGGGKVMDVDGLLCIGGGRTEVAAFERSVTSDSKIRGRTGASNHCGGLLSFNLTKHTYKEGYKNYRVLNHGPSR